MDEYGNGAGRLAGLPFAQAATVKTHTWPRHRINTATAIRAPAHPTRTTLSRWIPTRLEAAGENYCMAFYESYGLTTTRCATRTSSARGRSGQSYCGVVAKFAEALFAAGSGDPRRRQSEPRLHVIDDAVEATILAATSERAIGEVFNVGTGRDPGQRLAAVLIA